MNILGFHSLAWVFRLIAQTLVGRALIGGTLILGLGSPTAMAHGDASKYAELTERSPTAITIPAGVTLRDQHGTPVDFADLVKDKVVAINTVFTTCTTICSTAGLYFAQLSRPQYLGGRVGKDVHLISITVDPAVDTPARLAAWRAKLGGGPGWTLLTGPKGIIDDLLRSLRMYTPDKRFHAPVVLIGKQSSSEWVHTDGLAPPRYLAASIKALLPPS